MRYFIEFSYHGQHYFGYQIQPKQKTVQETLEHALSVVLRQEVKTTGAGRTDTGVHAKKMYAHFDIEAEYSNQWVEKLNGFLPADISVRQIFRVQEQAHARFDALYRTYEYYISLEKSPFHIEFAWQMWKKSLDLKAMNEACKIILQYKDFESFSKKGSDNKTTFCSVEQAFWEAENNLLKFTIQADRFLRNMVRALVGTLVDVGLGKYSANELHQIISDKNRGSAGTSAPAQGLFLVDIGYEFEKIRHSDE